MCNIYGYMYAFVFVYINVHKHIWIYKFFKLHRYYHMVYNRRHLGLFFLTPTLLLNRESLCQCSGEILRHQDLNLQFTFIPGDMIKPRSFNSIPGESFQTPESS